MKSITVAQAQSNLNKMIEETIQKSEPIQIIGKRGNAVLMSESEWQSINDTLYLLSVPGIRKSILEAMDKPKDKSSENSDR